jgi:hypothetical protein
VPHLWWGEAPERPDRFSEVSGDPRFSCAVRPIKRADLSNVAFVAESIAPSSAGVVGAVAYRGPRLGAS